MKIHCIEGLGCYYLKPLTKAVQSLNLGVEVVTYPWTVKEISFDKDDIFCFHSFGLRALNGVMWHSFIGAISPYIFILDGRMPPWGTAYGSRLPYDHKYVFNYYQTGFVRGYPIEGAENHLIKGFSHYRMPQNPAFLFKLMEVVKSANT